MPGVPEYNRNLPDRISPPFFKMAITESFDVPGMRSVAYQSQPEYLPPHLRTTGFIKSLSVNKQRSESAEIHKVKRGKRQEQNQQFTETVEKRASDLNDPAAGMEIRIAFQFLLFLAARADTGV